MALRTTAAIASSRSTRSPCTVPLGDGARCTTASGRPGLLPREGDRGLHGVDGGERRGRDRQRPHQGAERLDRRQHLLGARRDVIERRTVRRAQVRCDRRGARSRARSSGCWRARAPGRWPGATRRRCRRDAAPPAAAPARPARPCRLTLVLSIATAPPRPPRGVQRVIATVTRGDGPAADSVSTTKGAGGSPAWALAMPSAIAGQRASTERYGWPVPGAAIPSHSRARGVQRRTTPASSVTMMPTGSPSRTAPSMPSAPEQRQPRRPVRREPPAAWSAPPDRRRRERLLRQPVRGGGPLPCRAPQLQHREDQDAHEAERGRW